MSNDLLPPSASRMERVAARVCASLGEVPVPLRQLWNPWTCRTDLLPYLAWAFSVDRWDEAWPISTKRKAVADAFYLHKYKGTTGAMRRVVEPFGFFIRVNEWWNIDTAPGTFTLDIGVEDQGISEETYQELERLIADVKPCSRHMLGMSLHLQTTGDLYIGAGSYSGDTLTVYPYFPETIAVGGDDYTGAAIHLIDTVEIASGD
ncbi:phage tail protein I [Enterobacter asburiae]|uniref:phage tail protein I n=1 Tax=Enterobacteriaceae TaxID=543 RepID=UPI001D08153D|nr:phage tail protein I [Enterobacter asburiae]MCB7495863.1 phage tail protein I [Enterobacter roggenkampii]